MHIQRGLPRYYDWLVSAIVLTGPLIVYGILVGGASMRFSRLFILLIAPLVVLRFASKPGSFSRDRFLLLGVVPYMAYTTLSVLWSQNVETGTALQRIGGLYEVIIVYAALSLSDLSPERFLHFAKLYVWSAVLPLFVSIWQVVNNFLNFSETEVPFARFAISGKYEEVVSGRYFVTTGLFSRTSATFGEPVIYGAFLSTAFLLSLLLKPRTRVGRAALLVFRLAVLGALVLTVSKLALLSLAIGLMVIGRRNKRVLGILLFVMLAFAGIVGVLRSYGFVEVFARLVSESGHYELLMETLDMMRNGDLVLGEGIGSVPYGSFHRLILSRIYESGIVGLIFVGFVTVNPLRFFRRLRDPEAERINLVAGGVMCATVFGLHTYDFFIHLWPWTVTGAAMSFYYNTRRSERLARQPSAARLDNQHAPFQSAEPRFST